ncbi:MAG TPA: YceI family protein [Bacteroidota bacterium]|nr:YceI family protein [Bacteroidota bacterium]
MTQWAIDPVHSEVKFKVKHLVISTVTGQFNSVRGTVQANKSDFSDARVRFEADVESINTNNAQRDAHLKSADFFDAANYPTLSFESKSIQPTGDNAYQLQGDMTIRGTTRPVALNVTYNGTVKGFDGDVAAFDITGKLNRQDFGLRWNAMTETGGVVVSDEVKIEIAVELKQAEVAERVAA